MSKSIDQQLQSAFSLHRAGNLDKAADIYRQIVDADPNNFYALQYLGIIEASLGHFELAKSLMARSLMINPPNIQFIENYATVLVQTGDFEYCSTSMREGASVRPNQHFAFICKRNFELQTAPIARVTYTI